jgi:hypothetical protein
MQFEVEFEREEDGRRSAAVEGLPGVLAYGSTRKEARANVEALHKKFLKNSLRIRRLQKKSGMEAMTDNCDQDKTLDSGFGERLFNLLLVLSLKVFIAYFGVRVAWDIFKFSYPMIGARGTLCLISSSVIYLVLLMATKSKEDSIVSVTGQILTPELNYFRKNSLSILIWLSLPMLAVILAVSIDKSRQMIQIFPLLILLLSFAFTVIFNFYQLVLKSLQRMQKTGSILPPTGMCNCCKKDKSSQQITFLNRGLSIAPLWILHATLWTSLLVIHCYQRHSFLNQSGWVMTAFWWAVLGSWFSAVGWIVTVVRSINEHRKSLVTSNL